MARARARVRDMVRARDRVMVRARVRARVRVRVWLGFQARMPGTERQFLLAGELLYHGVLTTPKDLDAGDTVSVAIGAISVTLA